MAVVPSKLLPALPPTLVLYCASDASIIFFAVNIPAWILTPFATTLIPVFAVIIPTESIFVTSSYV